MAIALFLVISPATWIQACTDALSQYAVDHPSDPPSTVPTEVTPSIPTTVTTAPTSTTPANTLVPVTTVPATTVPATTVPATTVPPTTSTTSTTVPQVIQPDPGSFPSSATTGRSAATVMQPWTGSYRTSRMTLPTTTVDGVTYKVIDGYLFDTGTSGNFLGVDDPYVIIRNSRFVTSGQVSNTSAMVQAPSSNRTLIVENSEFDGGPYFQRGIQSDGGDLFVTRSRFHNTGEAGIEKNDRAAASSLVVAESYFSVDKGWPRGQHVDGIQIGGARNVTIHHNTVLVQPFGGAEGDESYVSNSALGLWAELGNVSGTVTVDNNLLAGGGRTIYIEQKRPYAWQGPVNITDNTFDTRFGDNAAVWGPLYPKGLPANLTWTGNALSDGQAVPLNDALHDYP